MRHSDYLAHAIINTAYHPDRPAVGIGLVLAGFVPFSFDSAHLSAVYFALLIPPAAFHCYAWVHKAVIPFILTVYKRIRVILTWKKPDTFK